MKPVIVTTTCADFEEAEKIARLVLANRLAACVQITPVQSMYWWKGKIESGREYLLNIKSKRSFFEKLASSIKKNHSYDVPEIIATDIIEIDQPYGNWLIDELTESR